VPKVSGNPKIKSAITIKLPPTPVSSAPEKPGDQDSRPTIKVKLPHTPLFSLPEDYSDRNIRPTVAIKLPPTPASLALEVFSEQNSKPAIKVKLPPTPASSSPEKSSVQKIRPIVTVKLPSTSASSSLEAPSNQKIKPIVTFKLPPTPASFARGESSDRSIAPTILEVKNKLEIQPKINECKDSALSIKDLARSQILDTFLKSSLPIGMAVISALEHSASTQAATHTQLVNLLKTIDPAQGLSVSEVAVLVRHLNRLVGDVEKTWANLQSETINGVGRWRQLKEDIRGAELGL
jgi:hypothetical protein